MRQCGGTAQGNASPRSTADDSVPELMGHCGDAG